MWERIFTVLRKEFRSVLRDPRMRLVILVLPVIQTLIFGYAVSLDVRHVRLGILDRDQTPASRALVARFAGSSYFDVVAFPRDEAEARRLIDASDAAAILQINAGYEGDLHGGRTAAVQLIVDGADSNTARFVLNYSLQRSPPPTTTRSCSTGCCARPAGPFPPAAPTCGRAPGSTTTSKAAIIIVPGIIAKLVMLVSLMLTSMAIVREKGGGDDRADHGDADPAGGVHPRQVRAVRRDRLPDVAHGRPGRRCTGSTSRSAAASPCSLLGTAFFLLSTLGIGLFISTVSQTQQQAMMTTFFFFFPAMLFSGFIFPIANMPAVIRWLSLADPLRYFLIIIRGIFLKGIGWDLLWPQFIALLGIGLIVLTFAVNRFHKTL